MEVSIRRAPPPPIKEVILTLSEGEAWALKHILENFFFKHGNTVPSDADRIFYYPLKRALKGYEEVDC